MELAEELVQFERPVPGIGCAHIVLRLRTHSRIRTSSASFYRIPAPYGLKAAEMIRFGPRSKTREDRFHGNFKRSEGQFSGTGWTYMALGNGQLVYRQCPGEEWNRR
jgi:hypothetical protein